MNKIRVPFYRYDPTNKVDEMCLFTVDTPTEHNCYTLEDEYWISNKNTARESSTKTYNISVSTRNKRSTHKIQDIVPYEK